jgi:hypothetical protein
MEGGKSMTLKLTKKQIYTFKGTPIEALYENDKDLDTRISALDGAGETKLTQLENSDNAADIIVSSATKVADWKPLGGDATIASSGAITLANNAVTQAKVGDDAIGAAELKVVERNITIAGGAAAGTVTNAADANGIVLGVVPYSAVASAIIDVDFTTETGALTVTLASAQGAETPATVTAVILQA